MNFLALFFISSILLFSSCVPATVSTTMLPPLPEDRGLQQVMEVCRGISRIDATFSVIFEKPDSEIRGEGELNMSSNGDLELRVYSLGFLAMELTSHNGVVKSNPRLDSSKKAVLTQGIRDGLFWWDMKDFTVDEKDGMYTLRNSVREITIDKKSGLPKQQRIYLDDGKVLSISYGGPAQGGGVPYQSTMKIDLTKYTVTLQVRTIQFGM